MAIPVSALLRAGPDRLLFALAQTRGSTAWLRTDPRTAVSVNGPGLSLCVEGVARIAADPSPAPSSWSPSGSRRSAPGMRAAPPPRWTRIRWRWTTEEAAARHCAVMAALAALASSG